MTETRIGGRPRGKEMPCGWQCGALLTASEMRGHFTTCPNRDQIIPVPQPPAPSSFRQSVAPRTWATATQKSKPKSDMADKLRDMREASLDQGDEPDANPQPVVSDRMAGLRTLLQVTEERVGMGELPEPWPKAPISRGETRLPHNPFTTAIRDASDQATAEQWTAERLHGQGSVEAQSRTPYQQSENRRAWAMKFSKLKALGGYDPGGAAEEFAELVKGHQLPKGFMQWTDPRKMEWLLENVELKED